jgi:hypothetical protein
VLVLQDGGGRTGVPRDSSSSSTVTYYMRYVRVKRRCIVGIRSTGYGRGVGTAQHVWRLLRAASSRRQDRSIHRRPPWGWSRQHPRAPRGAAGGLRCTLLVLSCRLFLGSSTSSLAHVPARDLPRAVWFEVDLSAVRVRLVGCRLSAHAPYGWRLAWARAYFPTVNLGFIRFERKINDLNSEGLIFTSVI